MTSPINLQIKRFDGTWDIIEAAPLLIEQGHELIANGTYQLYRGFPEFDSNLFDFQAMRERYVESLELTGEDNPGYLGELHFTGIGFFEWKYVGDQLQDSEVWQIVDCIQDYAAGKEQPMANGIILPRPEQPEDESLYFKYGKDQVVTDIRLEEMEGDFIVLIDGNPTAKFELLEQDWEITGGDIYDADLLAEILRRIKANTSQQ
jgi:hypothetical protein